MFGGVYSNRQNARVGVGRPAPAVSSPSSWLRSSLHATACRREDGRRFRACCRGGSDDSLSAEHEESSTYKVTVRRIVSRTAACVQCFDNNKLYIPRSATYDFILTGKTYDFTMVSSHMSHAGIGTAVSFLVSDPSNCVYDRVGYF